MLFFNVFTSIIYFLSLITVLVYFSKFLYNHFRILKLLMRLPGPKGNFFLGHYSELMASPEKINSTMRKWAKDFGGVHVLRIGTYAATHIYSPEDVEIFLSSRKHSTKSILYTILSNWLNEGLLLSDGAKWLKRRKILTPAFHFNILKDFVNVFNEEVEEVIEKLAENCGKDAIDVVPIVYNYSLKSVSETAMGYKLDSNSENLEEYLKAIHEYEKLLRYRLMKPYYLSPFLWNLTSQRREEKRLLKILHNFTREVINKRMRDFKGIPDIDAVLNDGEDDNIYMGNKRKRLAMLDILLQAKMDGEEIDYEGICEEVDTFMFEGHDTTGAAMSFCLLTLANHPEIQEQVYSEITFVLNEKKIPNYHDLQKMELMERCIKETLRLFPSVYLIAKNVDEDLVLNSGYTLPKYSTVYIDIIDLHRNSNVYPDPERFDPDRFLQENCQRRHPFAFVPFSAGPRNCIGQRFAMLEMKAFITGILQRFILVPGDILEEISLKSEIILRTVDGIRVKFIPRF